MKPYNRLVIICSCFLFLGLALFQWTCRTPVSDLQTKKDTVISHPKNIILMIGDGMGLSQISAAMYANRNSTILEKFPVVGFHKSHSANDLVTDSAAGATAFSCGCKTYNGAIGLNVDTIACKTILEEAEERNLATGLVATSTVVHATPASFIAHQKIRVFYEKIAKDFLDTEIDFVVGGGKKYFDRREEDNLNLNYELVQNGYFLSSFLENKLENIQVDYKRNFFFFTADSEPLPAQQGRHYLPYASKLAVNFLHKHSDQGFFLMIEGSQIDWGGHANQARMVLAETSDFNKAIAKVLSFAKKDQETLVIVTADHETGGFAIQNGSTMKKLDIAFTTNGHTASMIPVFAYGPGAELFSGIYENTAIYDKMRQAYQWDKDNN